MGTLIDLKPKTQLWSPRHQIINNFLISSSEEKNEGLKRNKEIWLRKTIKPIIRVCFPDSVAFASSIIMDLGISKTLPDNLMLWVPDGYWYFIRIP